MRNILRPALKVDWPQFEPAIAVQCSIAIAVALAAGIVFGNPEAGLFAAIGAVSAGFGAFQGTYRTRAAVMTATSLMMAVSIFAGMLAAGSVLATAIVTGLWGFCGGFLVAFGPAASFVGLQMGVALILGPHLATTPGHDAVRSGWVFAGGFLQTVILVAIWPLRRFPLERQALAAVYRSLGDYALSITRASADAPEPNTMASVYTILSDPQPFARPGEITAFRGLLDEAERIRIGLTALARDRERVPEPGEKQRIDELARGISAVLRETAAALEQARGPANLRRIWPQVDEFTAELKDEREAHPIPEPDGARPWIADSQMLLGQIRTVLRIARSPFESGGQEAMPRPWMLLKPPDLAIRDAANTIRADFTLRSDAFRHALRLAVALALGTGLYHSLGWQRGYWLPLTILIVLKPDFQQTFTRGVSRIAGTLIGGGLATLVAHELRPGPLITGILVIVFVWSSYAMLRVNYALFAVCLTSYVVFMLAFAGQPEQATALLRITETAIGGAFALAAYALWPTLEAPKLPELLADLLDAQARFGIAVLRACADPQTYDPGAMQDLLTSARLLRSNTEAAVDRVLGEPGGERRTETQLASGTLAAIRRYAVAALTLYARLGEKTAQPAPELKPLVDQLAQNFAELSRALRTRTAPRELAPLRRTLLGVADSLEKRWPGATRAVIGGGEPDPASGALIDPSLLLSEVDLIVDSVNTIAALLERAAAEMPGRR